MTPKELTDLETLAAYAEGYAGFAMKNIGRVPPMLAISPEQAFLAAMGVIRDALQPKLGNN